MTVTTSGSKRGNDEDYAKNWQVAAVAGALNELKNDFRTFDGKQDNMKEELLRKLDEMPKNFVTKEQLVSELKLVHAEYKPMKRNIAKALWTMAGVGIVAAMQFLINIGAQVNAR
jgi:hypothetical protein